MAPSWNGAKGGTVTLDEVGAEGAWQAVRLSADAGQHEVSRLQPLTLRFSLLLTPGKKRDLASHVKQRHYHTRYGQWNPPTREQLSRLQTSVLESHECLRPPFHARMCSITPPYPLVEPYRLLHVPHALSPSRYFTKGTSSTRSSTTLLSTGNTVNLKLLSVGTLERIANSCKPICVLAFLRILVYVHAV